VELKKNGGIFDDHCMDGEDGQKILLDLRKPIVYETRKKYDKISVSIHKDIVLEKQTYDVWAEPEKGGNPRTAKVFDLINADVYVFLGFAEDFCVKAAAIGAAEHFKGKEKKLYILEDCIKAVTEEGSAETRKLLNGKVKYMTSREFMKMY
jgi:nicotinamidase-related amidase